MEITEAQVAHFHRNGFFLIANPLAEEDLRRVEQMQQEIEPEWEKTEWPEAFNRLACQFLMLGEQILQLVEQPHLVDLARRILGCDDVHIGACGLGDASKIVAEDGRQQRQVHWHTDGRTSQQVSLRTALDRHDPTNAPLRILPGSHLRCQEEVQEEFWQLELATGQHDDAPKLCFARHPLEVEVVLDPRSMLVWTPRCWHATGVKTAAGPRRALGWNYYPRGGRTRDREALKHIFADQWEGWSEERKKLWRLDG